MDDRLTLSTAGNTLAPALATLRQLGYTVSGIPGSRGLLKAESAQATFIAEDLIQLLGLSKLHEMRGRAWMPTDREVSEFLAFKDTLEHP